MTGTSLGTSTSRRFIISAWASLQPSEEQDRTCPVTSGSCCTKHFYFRTLTIVWWYGTSVGQHWLSTLRGCKIKPSVTSSELLRQTLGWTTLEKRRRNALLSQVHRSSTNQAPSYLCSKFMSNSSLHYAEARGSTKLHLPHPRTKFHHSGLEFQGAKIFNSLPKSIRELKERKQFRHAVQRYSSCFHL